MIDYKDTAGYKLAEHYDRLQAVLRRRSRATEGSECLASEDPARGSRGSAASPWHRPKSERSGDFGIRCNTGAE